MDSKKNLTAGMFSVTFMPFLWSAVISITRRSLSGRANDGVIMIIDGVYWAHEDKTSLSSAVHNLFLTLGLSRKFKDIPGDAYYEVCLKNCKG